MTTTYEIDTALLKALLPLFVRAEDALARLDERALRSSIASGFSERRHFFDAIGAMWVAGELVHLEDLVLHDAHMDVRAPSHELTIAHAILRARRRIWTSEALWALSDAGISVLTGIGGEQDRAPESKSAYPDHDQDDHEPDALLTAELAEIDAVLARSSRLLDDLARGLPQVVVAPLKPSPDQNQDRVGLFDDEEWDEAARLREWQSVIAIADELPPTLGAALLFDAWEQIEPLRRQHWLGGLLVAGYLRQRGKVTSHLFSFFAGLKTVRHERRRSRQRLTRLQSFLEAMLESADLGLKEMDRLSLAQTQMEMRFKDRRSNSSLPELAQFVLSRPMVSSAMVARELRLSSRGALNLLNDIGIREITGRGRYRAWGII
ncbi:RHE_PE00001 family protein [Rhizobium sp. 18055]|uniref:RHE_PE00001 family protein n=1 Tax=Rhizobium sp. 18055 TaxID=2681403 RepID=UPI00135BDDAE|nr:RHE_PE00001 family protein [Rhizobium sp. 18055]